MLITGKGYPMQVYDGSVDKGLEGVVACTTAISSIVNSNLFYRGYGIEDLVENSGFEEVIFLLWNDRLPDSSELAELKSSLGLSMGLEPELVEVLKKLPTDIHPMSWLRSAVSLMGLWDKSADSIDGENHRLKSILLSARMGPLVALFHRIREGLEWFPPKKDKSLAWNFLYMLKGQEADEEMVKIFDSCLILHADHELNCSAFSARVTASSLSDINSAVVSAIGALKGPLHGGANEQVMKTLMEIGSREKIIPWLEQALGEKRKIMGFGHRVYKQGDPRAKILRQISQGMAEKSGDSKWFEMSMILDKEMKARKGLLPNVDFYSATVYHSMGIPLDLFTPVFSVSRVSGWTAHIIEQYANNRIYRPRGRWVGASGRKYNP